MKIVADANIPFVKECFSSIGEVVISEGRKISPEIVSDAEILLIRSITKVNEALLAKSNVRFVGTATIGFDHVDIDYLRENNIGFASAPGSNANSAAEYVIAALLEIGQKHKIKLEGKSTGVIGVGNVGGRVVKKCQALGMKVLQNDPPLYRQTDNRKYVPLEELFNCDFITLHTPLTFDGIDKTYHLADENFFESLKRDCVFINASRGAVVESSALKSAIKERRLLAAGLDVWENEPEIETELLEMVDIGTPHVAGYSLDGKIAGLIMIYRSVCEYLGIEPKFSKDDFLPEPEVKVIKLDYKNDNIQEAVLEAVRKVCPIIRDDKNLRRILNEPSENRGRFFDNLRKSYPVRREFHNTRVVIKNQNNNLADILKGIGFEVLVE